MAYRVLADAVAVAHLCFVLFVVLGALLALRWPRAMWLHLPAAAWGAAVELAGWYCPLTPLELTLREHAGDQGYAGGFVAHYVLPVLYPTTLTRPVQVLLGLAVVAINVVIYWQVLREGRLRRDGRCA